MSAELPTDPAAQLPKGRHGIPRGVVIGHQRQRLIRAVPATVCVSGYAHLTVTDISLEAGVSRRTFYEHFRDKEDCFVASYREHTRELTAAVAGAASVGGDWQERARLALTVLLRFLAERPAVAQMLLFEAHAAGPTALAVRDEAMTLLTSTIAAGAAAAGPVKAPPLVRRTIEGSILELIYAWVAAGRAAELEQLLPTAMYLLLVVSEGPARAAAKAGLASAGASG